MLAINTSRELLEERHDDLRELCRINHVENFFNFIEEHDFLRRVDLWPKLEQSEEHLLRETRVLLEELHHAIRELGMIERQALHLVQRDEHTSEEDFMLFLQWCSETIDNRPENLKQLRNTVMPLRLVNKLEEHVVDRTPDKCTQVQELPVNAVERRFEEVALPRVFRVEQFKKIKHELLVDIPFCDVGVEIRGLDKPKEEFVNDLKMRPCKLENRLILFRIKCVSRRIGLRGYRTEEIRCKLDKLQIGSAGDTKLIHKAAHHVNDLGVYSVSDYVSLSRYIF